MVEAQNASCDAFNKARSQSQVTTTACTFTESGHSHHDTNTFCALLESSDASRLVGSCFLSLDTAECSFSNVSFMTTYNCVLQRISLFEPSEIILQASETMLRTDRLASLVAEQFPSCKLRFVGRKWYSSGDGQKALRFYANKDSIDAQNLIGPLCTASFAALMQVLNTVYELDLAQHSLRVVHTSEEGVMGLDHQSVKNLELLHSRPERGARALLDCFDHTKTQMGKRLVRSFILQPSTLQETISARFDAIGEIQHDSTSVASISSNLGRLPDLPRQLTKLVICSANKSLKFAEQKINDLLALRQALKALAPIAAVVQYFQSPLLIQIYQALTHASILATCSAMDEVLSESSVHAQGALALRHQRCYAVKVRKSGLNGMLDIARRTYKEAVDDAVSLASRYSQEYTLDINLYCDNKNGFGLSVARSDLASHGLPPNFVNISQRGNTVKFTSLELKKKSARADEALNEVSLMSEAAIEDLIERIRDQWEPLYIASDAVALLDVLLTFASVSTSRGYIRPDLGAAIVIKGGRHPMRDLDDPCSFVPNDTYCDAANRFQIITGANMSGKSTYLRQVMLIVIMAQIGCFVPAEYATITIIHRIFSQMSTDEGCDMKISGFSLEMSGMATILHEISKQPSLCIIDELGRGTSAEDALAINLAICEFLTETSAFVLFSTHFWQLQQVLEHKPCVACLHLVTLRDEDHDALVLSHHLENGRCSRERSGLILARSTSMPQKMVERASQIAEILEAEDSARHKTSASRKLLSHRKVLLNIHETLKQAYNSREGLVDAALVSWLTDLRNQAIQEMTAWGE